MLLLNRTLASKFWNHTDLGIGIQDAIHPLNLCISVDIKIYYNSYLKTNFCHDFQPNSIKRLPVIVWIHGGAYHYGSGDERGVAPLMDKPIVVVTFNYRLGIFGISLTEQNID